MAPVEFQNGSHIEVKAVKLTSTITQLPYEYYSLPFCLPKNGTLVYKSENLGKFSFINQCVFIDFNWFLGEVLRGDRITNTPYELNMAENVECKILCNSKKSPVNWNVDETNNVVSKIEHEYFVHL